MFLNAPWQIEYITTTHHFTSDMHQFTMSFHQARFYQEHLSFDLKRCPTFSPSLEYVIMTEGVLPYVKYNKVLISNITDERTKTPNKQTLVLNTSDV